MRSLTALALTAAFGAALLAQAPPPNPANKTGVIGLMHAIHSTNDSCSSCPHPGDSIMCRCVVLGLPFLVFLLTAAGSVGENVAKKDAPAAAATALEPWASKAQPGDVAKNRVENISTGEHKYIVVHGGTMDGTNCRSPMGCGRAA